MSNDKEMTPERAAELQARYAQSRREHRERLGLGHGVADRNSSPVK